MKIILFNGPPGCGKDTAAQHLYWNWDNLSFPGYSHFDRMSYPNKAAFAAITETEMNEFFENQTYEKIKDEPLELLGGKSYRKWQIDFSESFMKPLYGEAIFGRLLCERTAARKKSHPEHHYRNGDAILVPDCGFEIELAVPIEHLYTVHLIRIHRPGKTFANDSRSYVKGNCLKTRIIDLNNDGTEDEFKRNVARVVGDIV